jgi:hypothetical protein
MKKLRLDLDKLSVKSFIIEMEAVDAATYTQTPTQCSHMNMCLPTGVER